MFDIALYQPEIPPNTGNVIRLCANTGCKLYLIRPLGFSLDDSRLKRAGLDYHEYADVCVVRSLDELLMGRRPSRLIAFSTKGTRPYCDLAYQRGDLLLFGPETRGLPAEILSELSPDHVATIPMRPKSRSLNLSNAVAIVVYEAWRQSHFDGEEQAGGLG